MKLPTSEGVHVQTKLGFHHYVPKENSIQLQFAWLLSPTFDFERGVKKFFPTKDQFESLHFSFDPSLI